VWQRQVEIGHVDVGLVPVDQPDPIRGQIDVAGLAGGARGECRRRGASRPRFRAACPPRRSSA
jgi:hypothetical protein